jgi:hypothetical protein
MQSFRGPSYRLAAALLLPNPEIGQHSAYVASKSSSICFANLTYLREYRIKLHELSFIAILRVCRLRAVDIRGCDRLSLVYAF